MIARFNDNNHNNQDARADALIKRVYKLPKILVLTDQAKNKDNISKTPGGPGVKNPLCNAGDVGSIPIQGMKIPHATATN